VVLLKKETRVQKKQRRRMFMLRLFFIFLIVTAMAIFAIRSSFFKVDEIVATEGNSVSEEEILEAAGISKEDNILIIRRKAIVERLESIPYVKSASIKKKLPDTVEIEIIERKPYLQFENGYSFAVIDTEGVLLENSILKLKDIGLVKGISWEYIPDGGSIIDKTQGASILDLLNDQNITSVVGKIEVIDLGDSSNIKFNLFNGIAVEFGPMNNVKYKLKVLGEILADVEKKNIPTKMILMNKGEHPILVRDDI